MTLQVFFTLASIDLQKCFKAISQLHLQDKVYYRVKGTECGDRLGQNYCSNSNCLCDPGEVTSLLFHFSQLHNGVNKRVPTALGYCEKLTDVKCSGQYLTYNMGPTKVIFIN